MQWWTNGGGGGGGVRAVGLYSKFRCKRPPLLVFNTENEIKTVLASYTRLLTQHPLKIP